MNDDILIELARTVRELTQAAERRIASRQLGEAWVDLVDHRGPNEGREDRAA